ncbi:hypothetical protein BaOVIS_016460 [Babesia ovis]|uniref:Uncharacterized protein n=1 Tax=Babesia ovis TaxID=5869 RepID=A0A9W5TD47_BABOV|nr:hypothetical protein BaOVIS_016460 [Babesia ovis]
MVITLQVAILFGLSLAHHVDGLHNSALSLLGGTLHPVYNLLDELEAVHPHENHHHEVNHAGGHHHIHSVQKVNKHHGTREHAHENHRDGHKRHGGGHENHKEHHQGHEHRHHRESNFCETNNCALEERNSNSVYSDFGKFPSFLAVGVPDVLENRSLLGAPLHNTLLALPTTGTKELSSDFIQKDANMKEGKGAHVDTKTHDAPVKKRGKTHEEEEGDEDEEEDYDGDFDDDLEEEDVDVKRGANHHDADGKVETPGTTHHEAVSTTDHNAKSVVCPMHTEAPHEHATCANVGNNAHTPGASAAVAPVTGGLSGAERTGSEAATAQTVPAVCPGRLPSTEKDIHELKPQSGVDVAATNIEHPDETKEATSHTTEEKVEDVEQETDENLKSGEHRTEGAEHKTDKHDDAHSEEHDEEHDLDEHHEKEHKTQGGEHKSDEHETKDEEHNDEHQEKDAEHKDERQEKEHKSDEHETKDDEDEYNMDDEEDDEEEMEGESAKKDTSNEKHAKEAEEAKNQKSENAESTSEKVDAEEQAKEEKVSEKGENADQTAKTENPAQATGTNTATPVATNPTDISKCLQPIASQTVDSQVTAVATAVPLEENAVPRCQGVDSDDGAAEAYGEAGEVQSTKSEETEKPAKDDNAARDEDEHEAAEKEEEVEEGDAKGDEEGEGDEDLDVEEGDEAEEEVSQK